MDSRRMKHAGFSLIELMIVILILGIVSAIAIPSIGKRGLVHERRLFISRLNSLLQFAWQQAITGRTAQRIEFDFAKGVVTLFYQVATEQNEAKFVPTQFAYTATTIPIPTFFSVKRFIVEGFDEMSRFSGGRTTAVWFLINAQGIPQITSIFLTYQKPDETRGELLLELNPFSLQFVEK